MVIVHVVRQFHPSVGGLENHVLDLASAQIVAGNQVRVVTLDRLFKGANRQKLPATDNVGGIEIVRVPYVGSPRYPIAPSVLRHIADADLVHVHAIDFFFDFLAWTRPFHGRKLIASTHGAFFHTPYAARLKRLWFSTITRLSSRFYASIIAVSASDFELFRPVHAKGTVFVEEGVNLSKFADAGAQELRKSIISFGRFSQNKRIDLLVEFMRALLRHDPEWKLTIAGRPDDLSIDDVNALVANAGLEQAVDVVASPTDSTLKDLIGGSSFIASASDYEGFGIAPIEGLSAGLFPLLSGIPPFKRLVARTGFGLILDFKEPEEAARHLLNSASGMRSGYAEQRSARIGAAGAYDWRSVCRKHTEVYNAATGAELRTLLDIPVQVKTFDDAVSLIDAHNEACNPTAVAFANANLLNVAAQTPGLRHALRNAIVLNDGIGVDIGSRVLYGSPFPENLNGTDFVPYYLEKTKHRYKIYLLGAKPHVVEHAARRLSALYPRHEIVGWHHGYIDEGDASEVIDVIRRSGADVMLVATGNPKQELFIHDHLAATGCRLGIGVGALFDFVTGEVPRATSWMRRWRLEWVYRLSHEPIRLWRRYLVGNPVFLMRILKQWWAGAHLSADSNPEREKPEQISADAADDAVQGNVENPGEPASRIDQEHAAA